MFNYKIILADLVSSTNQTCTNDMNEFVYRCGINRFISNMENMWCTDVRGLDGYQADGECVFIDFDSVKKQELDCLLDEIANLSPRGNYHRRAMAIHNDYMSEYITSVKADRMLVDIISKLTIAGIKK